MLYEIHLIVSNQIASVIITFPVIFPFLYLFGFRNGDQLLYMILSSLVISPLALFILYGGNLLNWLSIQFFIYMGCLLAYALLIKIQKEKPPMDRNKNQ